MSNDTLESTIRGLGLPSFLSERIHVRRGGPIRSTNSSAFVLYISTVALRAEENPALDVAVHFGRSLNLPVLSHGFFNDRHTHATARRAHFVIDSAREAQQGMLTRGVICTYQVMKPGQRQPRHMTLAARAAVVVTDEPFVEPHLSVLSALLRAGSTPLVTVDTACILPARLTNRGDCDRAFRFRQKTSSARSARISLPYPTPPTLTEELRAGSLRARGVLESLRLDSVDLPRITDTKHVLEGCALDWDVAPVTNTHGGETRAKRRWKDFFAKGLRSYAAKRNDPLKHHAHGVSRMSAYLNLGVISPFKIGRETAGVGGGGTRSGPGKFLDEFCVWRELAYSFCYHVPKHLDAKAALPSWAYTTLQSHANDGPQGREKSREELRACRSREPLWDLAQESLVRNGELHNNLRMTWGKEILRWTRGPDDAYRMLQYLNDHYALDGLSPPSYAGLLWCLGWADGPKRETSIFGKVRPRSARSIARRYDLAKLRVFIRGVEGGGILAAFSCDRKSLKRKNSTSSIVALRDDEKSSGDSATPAASGGLRKKSNVVAWLKKGHHGAKRPNVTKTLNADLVCDGDRFKGLKPAC